jgi:hypothetical protein
MKKTISTGARSTPVGRPEGAPVLFSSSHIREQVYTKNWYTPRNLQPWKGKLLVVVYICWYSIIRIMLLMLLMLLILLLLLMVTDEV